MMFDPLRASLPVAAIVAQAMLPSVASAQTGAQITGTWQTEDGSMKIEMFDAGGTYAGRLLYGRRAMEADGRTFKLDANNPDPKLRSRSLERIVILQKLKWNAGEKRWEGGTLYDGTSGRTYSARVTLVDGKMQMRGYMGSPMLGRTMTLRRVAA